MMKGGSFVEDFITRNQITKAHQGAILHISDLCNPVSGSAIADAT